MHVVVKQDGSEVTPERKIHWSVPKTVTAFQFKDLVCLLREHSDVNKKKKGVFEVRSFEKNSLWPSGTVNCLRLHWHVFCLKDVSDYT